VVERGRGHPGGELDVASKIEAIGHVVEVPLDLGLFRVPTRPLPLVGQLAGERVAVVVALGVAPCAGIAIPVPRATDTIAGLDASDAHVQVVAQLGERVETGEPRSDHDSVEVVLIIHGPGHVPTAPLLVQRTVPSRPSLTNRAVSASPLAPPSSRSQWVSSPRSALVGRPWPRSPLPGSRAERWRRAASVTRSSRRSLPWRVWSCRSSPKRRRRRRPGRAGRRW